MNAKLKNPVVLVWILLVIATLATWFVGIEHGLASGAHAKYGLAAILAIAFLKTQAVGSFFMELRTAPPPLRLAFSAWVFGVGALIIAMYLLV